MEEKEIKRNIIKNIYADFLWYEILKAQEPINIRE